MKQWLIGCHVWDEEDLRIHGWTDEHLRAPYAYRVRERVPHMSYSRCVQVDITNRRGRHVNSVITEPVKPVKNFKPTHFHNGPYGGDCTVENINNKLCITTFSDGRSVYTLRTDVEPIINDRDELIDDIEALCLSIEKRQNELSRLVKKLKG